MYRGIKIRIYPNSEQKELLNTNIDVYRSSFNIALGIQLDNYKSGNSYIKFYEMCKIMSNLRNSDCNYKWLRSVSVGVIRQSLLDLDTAFKMFFNKINRFPRFKSKKHSKKMFTTRSDRCYSKGDYIYISGIGMIYCKNNKIPEGVRLRNTHISFDGYDKYYFSCTIDRAPKEVESLSGIVGIDVGIRNMITTSDGEFYHFSDTSKYEKRLKRQQRRLSKYHKRYLNESIRTKTKYEDIPKSKNMQKKAKALFKTYQKIKNKRHNDMNTATKRIVDKNPEIIVIETLDAMRMVKSMHKSYKPLVYFAEIHRQLAYKAEERGITIIRADKGYPSTQMCSRCGNRRKVYDHLYRCNHCGLRIDRDLNAAYNLKNFGIFAISKDIA